METMSLRFCGQTIPVKRTSRDIRSVTNPSAGIWRWASGDGKRLELQNAAGENFWLAFFKTVWPELVITARGESPQVAVAAVEQKIREHRDAISKFLNEGT